MTISLSIAALAFCVLIMITTNMHSKLAQVSTIKVTDTISIPVPAGNGQYGNERFLTDKEKKALYGAYVVGTDTEFKGGLR